MIILGGCAGIVLNFAIGNALRLKISRQFGINVVVHGSFLHIDHRHR